MWKKNHKKKNKNSFCVGWLNYDSQVIYMNESTIIEKDF